MLGFSPYGFGAVTVKRAAGLLIDGVDIRVFGVSCQYRFVNMSVYMYTFNDVNIYLYKVKLNTFTPLHVGVSRKTLRLAT